MGDTTTDRIDISEVLDDYARGVDSKDWDLVLSVFTDDALLDYSATGGPKGQAQEVVDWIANSVGPMAMTQHHITNRHITIDGDDAVCVAELFAPIGMPVGDGKMSLMFTGGSYNDRLRRTGSGWKIASRTFERSWLAMGPEASGPSGPKG